MPYTLLTIENGRCTSEERRIPWDVEATIAQVIKSDQYRCARVWSEIMFAAWQQAAPLEHPELVIS